jgi:hypothetical protein
MLDNVRILYFKLLKVKPANGTFCLIILFTLYVPFKRLNIYTVMSKKQLAFYRNFGVGKGINFITW